MSEQKPGVLKRLQRALVGVPPDWGSKPQATIGHPEDLLREMGRGARSAAGIYVTPESAMKVSAVFACVKVISEDLASMPLNVYRKTAKGREAADDHALQRILHDRANYWQTAMEFRELMQNWALLRGRAYALKARVRGVLDELLPIPFDHVRPVKAPTGMFFEVQPENGGAIVTYAAKDIFCLVGVGGGRSVISDAQDTVGLAIGEHQHASENYHGGGLTRIALEHPGALSEGAGQRLRKSWMDTYGGKGNHAKPAVLEEGMKANKIGLTAEELQFLEGRQFSVEDIARFFRVSPHKIGHLERATNNNIEELSIDHVTSTLRPWAVRWEQRIKMDLLDAPGEKDYFAKHVFDALLRGDPVKRHESYAKGRQWGYYSANDVRKREDEDPIPGGDTYMVPANMQDAGKPLPVPGAAAPAPKPISPEGDNPDA